MHPAENTAVMAAYGGHGPPSNKKTRTDKKDLRKDAVQAKPKHKHANNLANHLDAQVTCLCDVLPLEKQICVQPELSSRGDGNPLRLLSNSHFQNFKLRELERLKVEDRQRGFFVFASTLKTFKLSIFEMLKGLEFEA